ncbi:MAG: haloacid dehalogenase [Candidatus Binatia bacterium]|nr:MAG: haloacid dehalogenase [Candidatus Binatia bacterium]
MKPAAIVFDVDNTLTPPRAPLSPEMGRALAALAAPFHLAAGSDLRLVSEQLLEPLARLGFQGSFDAFVCNGADRYRCVVQAGRVHAEPRFRFVLRDYLGAARFAMLWEAIERVLDEPEFALPGGTIEIVGPRLIDRGSMINVVPMGRPEKMDAAAYAQREAFVAFDRETGYRRRLLERLRQTISPWSENQGLRVSLGGQTSFDVVVEGYDKRFPLRTLLAEGVERVLYFGDALHPEGNDRAVVEFIAAWPGSEPCPVEAVAVGSWQDTLHQLEERGLLQRKQGSCS